MQRIAATSCNNRLQHTCITLQHTAAYTGNSTGGPRQSSSHHCNSQQHTATHCCNTLQQHTTTYYISLQHIATYAVNSTGGTRQSESHCCNILQHTVATHCNTLHLTATHCNTLQHTQATALEALATAQADFRLVRIYVCIFGIYICVYIWNI